jgi:hypothetical protein
MMRSPGARARSTPSGSSSTCRRRSRAGMSTCLPTSGLTPSDLAEWATVHRRFVEQSRMAHAASCSTALAVRARRVESNFAASPTISLARWRFMRPPRSERTPRPGRDRAPGGACGHGRGPSSRPFRRRACRPAAARSAWRCGAACAAPHRQRSATDRSDPCTLDPTLCRPSKPPARLVYRPGPFLCTS